MGLSALNITTYSLNIIYNAFYVYFCMIPAPCTKFDSGFCQGFTLPPNVRATTTASEALLGSDFIIHAVPTQHSRALLTNVLCYIPRSVPVVSVAKGLEVGTGKMMSQVGLWALRKTLVAMIS